MFKNIKKAKENQEKVKSLAEQSAKTHLELFYKDIRALAEIGVPVTLIKGMMNSTYSAMLELADTIDFSSVQMAFNYEKTMKEHKEKNGEIQ